MFGFFRTLLLEPIGADSAVELARGQEYPGNDFFPSLPTIRSVFAGEAPWSRRLEVRFDDEDSYSRRAVHRDWNDEGIGFDQLAIELSTGEGESPTALKQSYDVPSFEFAARFGLRQMPGTLDLVGLDGVRASATFRTEEPWQGHLLFLRRDLVGDFADDRRIMQVAWGERNLAAGWGATSTWAHALYQAYEHVWRNIRLLDDH